ncbi:hypothetical protein O3P69_005097 [Scylla paramamosain]|uniref:Uncharacterized protein n=1 Tax=Scylla paramamosain TaxID=85552 RepID=A0AAW0U9X5_SCYPA
MGLLHEQRVGGEMESKGIRSFLYHSLNLPANDAATTWKHTYQRFASGPSPLKYSSLEHLRFQPSEGAPGNCLIVGLTQAPPRLTSQELDLTYSGVGRVEELAGWEEDGEEEEEEKGKRENSNFLNGLSRCDVKDQHPEASLSGHPRQPPPPPLPPPLTRSITERRLSKLKRSCSGGGKYGNVCPYLGKHATHSTYNPACHDPTTTMTITTACQHTSKPPPRPTVPRSAPESPKRAAAKSEVSGAARESSISLARLRETPGRDLSGFRLMARQRGISRESSGLAEGGGAVGKGRGWVMEDAGLDWMRLGEAGRCPGHVDSQNTIHNTDPSEPTMSRPWWQKRETPRRFFVSSNSVSPEGMCGFAGEREERAEVEILF